MTTTNLYKPSLLTLVIAATACNQESCAGPSSRADQMQKEQEAYQITHSVERDNINKRLKLANDPTQIMWIYCLSDMGNMVLSSPVVGKVTSSGKRLEPRETATSTEHGAYYTYGYVGKEKYATNEIMGADGTYGSSDSYVFWFTPEGQYFQWGGAYVLSNAPLKVDKPIFNVRDIDSEELKRGRQAEKALKDGKKVSNSLEVLVEDKK